MTASRGFTLIEVVLALALFALVVAATYAVILPAGEGFKTLQQVRDDSMQEFFLGRQMRLDVNALALPLSASQPMIKITTDQRGGGSFDELQMLIREANTPALTMVRYHLDETAEKPTLVRETALALPGIKAEESLAWRIGQIESFDVSLLGSDGQWVDQTEMLGGAPLPRALRLRWKVASGERELMFPVFLGEAR